MDELLLVLQLKRHSIVHDPMEEFYDSGIAAEYVVKGVAVSADRNSLALLQQVLIFRACVDDAVLVRNCWQGHVREVMERS